MYRTQRFAFGFCLVYLLTGLLCLVGAGSMIWGEQVVQRWGVHSVGYVASKYVAVSMDGGNVRYVDYWFSLPDGTRVHSSRRISSDKWDAIEPSRPIDVVYSQQTPANSRPVDGQGSLATLLFLFVVGILFVIAGIALLAEAAKAANDLGWKHQPQ